MRCPASDNYVRKSSNQNVLTHLQGEVLNDIQASLNTSATYGISTEDLFAVRYRIEAQDQTALYLHDPGVGGRFLEAPLRAFVVSHREWLANPRLTGRPSERGRYLYAPAVVLLHESENTNEKSAWCRKTLIHEVFHSVSIYSRAFENFPNIVPLHRSFIEGVTECLTGYILFKCHHDCYEGWKSNQMDRCSISYRESVKLWCSLSQCIGIRDIAQYYLSQENPTDAWNKLAESIRTRGFGFNYQLDPGRAFNEPQFRQVCIDAFPNFKSVYESSTKCLDFSLIP